MDGPEYLTLDDPEFLTARVRVREQLEHAPADTIGRAELAALYAAMNAEFDRRAGRAWSRVP
jgi:hypothetical protein